jgi:single-stranded-DNA-specific exonuclease
MSTLSLTGRSWRRLQAPEGLREKLQAEWGLHPLVTACLSLSAGHEDPDAWLAPDWSHLHAPELMHGLEPAVDRIRRAAQAGEHIRIVTDYDVDGTTSSLILQHSLRLMGATGKLSYHIPNRFDEGYGFSVRAAETAAADGAGLIITADIGVRDHEAVERATELGVDVIICDHHLPAGADVPDRALSVLCPPQKACSYPNPALAACGVSLKLATALLSENSRQHEIIQSMCKLAAMGTVADVVSLATLENRAIVSLGLRSLNRGPHAPGLQALLDVAGLETGQITSDDLGFRIGPRINAAGRLESATAVVELLNQRDPKEAARQATELDQINQRRRSVQEQLTVWAGEQLDEDTAFGVVWGEESKGWHRGVVGIVAARLRDRIHRPVAVVSVQGAWARGSIRSIPQVHAVNALDSASELLDRYGGHPAAAGFTIKSDRLPALAERLAAFALPHLDSVNRAPPLEISATAPVKSIDAEVVRAMQGLGPFGKDNPAPVIALAPLEPRWIRSLGKNHLRIGLGGIDAVWWNGAEHANRLKGTIELAGKLGFNTWQGRRQIRLTLEDARPGTPQEP